MTGAAGQSQQLSAEITEGGIAEKAQDEAKKALMVWKSVWQNKDMQAYFSAYDNHVSPNTKCVSFVQWKKYKQAVVPQHQDIRLVIETVEVEVNSCADEVSFVFDQNFKSNRLEERDCKQVVLRHEDEAWKIVKEVTL